MSFKLGQIRIKPAHNAPTIFLKVTHRSVIVMRRRRVFVGQLKIDVAIV